MLNHYHHHHHRHHHHHHPTTGTHSPCHSPAHAPSSVNWAIATASSPAAGLPPPYFTTHYSYQTPSSFTTKFPYSTPFSNCHEWQRADATLSFQQFCCGSPTIDIFDLQGATPIKPACACCSASVLCWARHESFVAWNTESRHTSHVTCHTSHVTCHTSHVTRHTSHVTRHTSHVTRHADQYTMTLPQQPASTCTFTQVLLQGLGFRV